MFVICIYILVQGGGDGGEGMGNLPPACSSSSIIRLSKHIQLMLPTQFNIEAIRGIDEIDISAIDWHSILSIANRRNNIDRCIEKMYFNIIPGEISHFFFLVFFWINILFWKSICFIWIQIMSFYAGLCVFVCCSKALFCHDSMEKVNKNGAEKRHLHRNTALEPQTSIYSHILLLRSLFYFFCLRNRSTPSTH